MGLRLNPPPGWPKPEPGWKPPLDWQPDPSWPKPPPGWKLWLQERWHHRHPILSLVGGLGGLLVVMAMIGEIILR
jgi:hypothetical protein